ncbi:Pyruvate/2-oxoglutarate dehydrogenase complex, dihydrolipoamide dehydrogenase (E3) component [Algoriphagus locisalis]|uniref:Pyruvate/2-oxoglutarate dehydrogenase complex, dihydrolipoamide dehydrogenase (E3) component n=1 Tax=Algoriphagus locisalis TaxID=305507 RepID=A0A1I7A5J4_9BACT|nr:mercuric reductase [Algoriphagus locisalis]SFT70140.1 Pyruvate/2-oxoglutarate dehydrogenase complex, dihydrolipoamide dehydrogenase (E3) component [Algoriphagus locisalis]
MIEDRVETFDAIIVGSGQAGNPLALALAKEKWKVAIVEKAALGGTCVNTGCTPTKAYVASARAAWAIANAPNLGIEVPKSPKVNLKSIKKRKDKLVNQSRLGIRKSLADSPQVTMIRGTASFIDKTRLKVGSRVLKSYKIFLNVGARARIPEGFEDVDYLTNTSILQLEKLPERLIIIGGSYIGLEFAQIFKRLGSKVTVLEMGDYLISKEDQHTSEQVREVLEKESIKVICGAHCLKGKNKKSDSVTVSFQKDGKDQKISGTHLLIATGRMPNSDLLKPEKAGLDINKRGFIDVNSKLETNIEGIFALGDCNGKGAFTHTAYNDYEIMEDQLFGEKKRTLDDRIINYALYIDPPLGRAGMTLSQAKESGKNLLFARMPMSEISRAKEKGETQGKMEVIVDAETEQILGAAVFGTGGDEIIGTFLTAMYGKLSYKTLMKSVQTHPTVTELIPTLLQQLKPIKN